MTHHEAAHHDAAHDDAAHDDAANDPETGSPRASDHDVSDPGVSLLASRSTALRRGVAIVSSTRAARGEYEDRTGPEIVQWLREHGFQAEAPVVVPDGPEVATALRAAVDAGLELVVTTGGTGIGPGDVTADATSAILTAALPGFQEELRRRGSAHTPYALMSRGVAGVAGGTFIVNLPGSPNGVRDGLALLGEVVDHVLDQLAGGRHGE